MRKCEPGHSGVRLGKSKSAGKDCWLPWQIQRQVPHDCRAGTKYCFLSQTICSTNANPCPHAQPHPLPSIRLCSHTWPTLQSVLVHTHALCLRSCITNMGNERETCKHLAGSFFMGLIELTSIKTDYRSERWHREAKKLQFKTWAVIN